MASILVIYGTSEGQTEKIAHHVAGVLTGGGHHVELVHAEHRPDDLDLSEYDGIVVGDSVHSGRHHRYVRRFVASNREALADRPSAFFQVSLTAAGEGSEAETESAAYVDEFVEATGWHPGLVGNFPGALAYSKYGPLKRFVMRRIAAASGQDTDGSRDQEFTDWGEVTSFAESFGEQVAAGTAERDRVTP